MKEVLINLINGIELKICKNCGNYVFIKKY